MYNIIINIIYIILIPNTFRSLDHHQLSHNGVHRCEMLSTNAGVRITLNGQ